MAGRPRLQPLEPTTEWVLERWGPNAPLTRRLLETLAASAIPPLEQPFLAFRLLLRVFADCFLPECQLLIRLPLPPDAPLLDTLNALQHDARNHSLPPLLPGIAHDFLSPLFEALVGPSLQRTHGEHYTPSWLVSHVLDRVGWFPPGQDEPESHRRDASSITRTLLDPACGAGAFLVSALARLRLRYPALPPERWLESLRGIDLQPHAVEATRLNLLLALRDLPDPPHRLSPLLLTHIVEADALQFLEQTDSSPWRSPTRPFTHMVGNPPWLGQERLSIEQRHQLRPLWEAEELYDLIGWQSRMGAGKRDLSMLFLARAASRWLSPGGTLGFVLPRNFLVSQAAKALRIRLEQGSLERLEVDDLSACRVFQDTTIQAIVLIGKRPTAPTRSRKKPTQSHSSLLWRTWQGHPPKPLPSERCPLPFSSPGAPWQVGLKRHQKEHGADTQPTSPPYQAREGTNTGGANGIYWLEPVPEPAQGLPQAPSTEPAGQKRMRNIPSLGRKEVPQVTSVLERPLLYPLLRGRDVRPWHASPSLELLMVQDPVLRQGIPEAQLRAQAPAVYAYLEHFRPLLATRPLFLRFFGDTDAPWYSLYNVGTYTFSPWKVVWREQGQSLQAAVVGPHVDGRPIIPDHKLMLVACDSADEAHYLCARLMTPRTRLLARALGTRTSAPPRVLEQLSLEKFDPADPRHQQWVALSKQAHWLRAAQQPIPPELDQALEGLMDEADGRVKSGFLARR